MKPSEEKLRGQGARIRQAIERAGKTQAEVCRELGVGTNTMNRWLRGENSARTRFRDLSLSLGVAEAWLEHGDGPETSERADVIEDFVTTVGPTLAPPLTASEAAYLRHWPHHRVTHGRLLDAVRDARMGLSADDVLRSTEATDAARAKGAALGVPRRKER